jgi:hypothetical protein
MAGRMNHFARGIDLNQDVSDQRENISGIQLAQGSTGNQTEWEPRYSTKYETNYQWHYIFNGQYITTSINAASMACGLVITVIAT